jgi:hypothetical protein
MDSNLLGTDVETVTDRLLDDASDDLYLINPTRDVLETVVETAGARASTPGIRVLAARRLLRDVMDDFIVASTTADLVEEGRLSLRTAEDIPPETVFITPDRVVALVSLGEDTAGISTDEPDYVTEATADLEALWAAAESYSLRTPAMTRVEETLSDAVGDEVEGDFAAMLSSMETARGDGDGLDEVTVSLLAAAKNQVLLYDISRWGEDADVASKATFSRTKSTLEEKGLIETEKVPIDVGRPRLRLKLADDRLADADADELASVAQSVLAS